MHVNEEAIMLVTHNNMYTLKHGIRQRTKYKERIQLVEAFLSETAGIYVRS